MQRLAPWRWWKVVSATGSPLEKSRPTSLWPPVRHALAKFTTVWLHIAWMAMVNFEF
jgi:hypothetical protein